MKRKSRYIKPQSRIIFLHGSMLMTYGSNKVNDYTQGSDITIGDTDDPPSTPTPARENFWGFTEED